MDKLDSQQVELIGVRMLEAELVKQGFEVVHPNRDRGIDLIVFTDEPSKAFCAVPIQVKASSEMAFGVYRKYEKFKGLIFVYIWHTITEPRFFIVPYQDACALIPEAQQRTKPWLRDDGRGGYYWTGRQIPKAVLGLLEKYEDRWDVIKNSFDKSS